MNNLRIAKQFYPNAKEVSGFKKRLETYKHELDAVIKPKLSQPSSATYNKESADWKLSMPQTYEDYRKDLTRRVSDDYKTTIDGIALGKKWQKLKPQLVIGVSIFNLSKFQTDPEYADDLKEICQNNAPKPLRDAASWGADRLYLGAVSVRDQIYGNGTVKHEMGHLTSGMFITGKMSMKTKGWYDRVRECLKEPKGHERNVEEDWADLMSAMAGAKYDNCLYTREEESEFTLKDDPSDTHSSNLYRHLHTWLVNNGTIPEICTESLAQKGEKFKAKDCSQIKSSQ